jgi:hypothetical protein
MRYKYKVANEKLGLETTIEAMSFKKMLKQIASKFSNTIVSVSYQNKKNNSINKIIDTSKIKQKN